MFSMQQCTYIAHCSAGECVEYYNRGTTETVSSMSRKNESRSLCSLTGNICWPRADSLCSWFRHQKHHEAFMMNHLNRNELVPLNAMTPKIKLRAPQHLLASATRLSTHGRGSFTCRETMFDPQQMVPVVFDPY